MDAALRVMSRNGYADMSVTDVLTEAGLSTRSFYRHFESKAALFHALLDREVERLAQALQDAVATAAGPVAAVEAWIEAYLDTFYDRRRAVRSARWSTPDASSIFPLARELAEIRWTLLRSLTSALRAGHRAGVLVSRHPDRDALSIFSIIGTLGHAPHLPMPSRRAARAHVRRFVWPALGLAPHEVDGQARP
jgi:AcrR family transcriptional regulator